MIKLYISKRSLSLGRNLNINESILRRQLRFPISLHRTLLFLDQFFFLLHNSIFQVLLQFQFVNAVLYELLVLKRSESLSLLREFFVLASISIFFPESQKSIHVLDVRKERLFCIFLILRQWYWLYLRTVFLQEWNEQAHMHHLNEINIKSLAQDGGEIKIGIQQFALVLQHQIWNIEIVISDITDRNWLILFVASFDCNLMSGQSVSLFTKCQLVYSSILITWIFIFNKLLGYVAHDWKCKHIVFQYCHRYSWFFDYWFWTKPVYFIQFRLDIFFLWYASFFWHLPVSQFFVLWAWYFHLLTCLLFQHVDYEWSILVVDLFLQFLHLVEMLLQLWRIFVLNVVFDKERHHVFCCADEIKGFS